MIDQLIGLQVFQVEKVIVEWTIKSPKGETIRGHADSGRVQISTAQYNRNLQIFLTSEDIEASCPPLELEEELSKFCGITDPRRVGILQFILMQSNTKSIEDALKRRGILRNIPDVEAEIQGKLFQSISGCYYISNVN